MFEPKNDQDEFQEEQAYKEHDHEDEYERDEGTDTDQDRTLGVADYRDEVGRIAESHMKNKSHKI